MFLSMKIPDNVRSPITVADYPHADDIFSHRAVDWDNWGITQAHPHIHTRCHLSTLSLDSLPLPRVPEPSNTGLDTCTPGKSIVGRTISSNTVNNSTTGASPSQLATYC